MRESAPNDPCRVEVMLKPHNLLVLLGVPLIEQQRGGSVEEFSETNLCILLLRQCDPLGTPVECTSFLWAT